MGVRRVIPRAALPHDTSSGPSSSGGVLRALVTVLVSLVGCGRADRPIVDVAVAELSLDAPHVRVKGMAHYPSATTQKAPATLVLPERTYHLFALFPEQDTQGKEIRVMVRTERAPEALVDFEQMTIEGWLEPASSRILPPSTEAVLSDKRGYFFAEDLMLLVPDVVRSGDEVWERPK